jgi:hypothetical protein
VLTGSLDTPEVDAETFGVENVGVDYAEEALRDSKHGKFVPVVEGVLTEEKLDVLNRIDVLKDDGNYGVAIWNQVVGLLESWSYEASWSKEEAD